MKKRNFRRLCAVSTLLFSVFLLLFFTGLLDKIAGNGRGGLHVGLSALIFYPLVGPLFVSMFAYVATKMDRRFHFSQFYGEKRMYLLKYLIIRPDDETT